MIESELFDRLRDLSFRLRCLFGANMQEYKNPKHTADLEGWSDWFWKSDVIRKAHLKTIEPVGKNKLWLMHINIFPQPHINLPIFGLDIVANPKKISGCFCDYSPVIEGPHPFLDKFNYETTSFDDYQNNIKRNDIVKINFLLFNNNIKFIFISFKKFKIKYCILNIFIYLYINTKLIINNLLKIFIIIFFFI